MNSVLPAVDCSVLPAVDCSVLPAVDCPHWSHGDDRWTIIDHRFIVSVIAKHGHDGANHYVDVCDEYGWFSVDQVINVCVGQLGPVWCECMCLCFNSV